MFSFSEDGNPPLYYLLLKLWISIIGYDDWGIRSLSAFIGVASVCGIYFLARQVGDIRFARITASVVCLDLFHIYYSQEARAYILLFFLGCLSSAYFIRLTKSFNFSDSIMFMLTSILLMYTHYFGVFILIAQVLSILICAILKSNYSLLPKHLIHFLIIGIFYLPWIIVVYRLAGLTEFPKYIPSIKSIIHHLLQVLGKDPIKIAAFLFSILMIFRKSILGFKSIYFPLWIIIPLTGSFLFSVINFWVFQVRYMMVSLASFIILTSLSLYFLDKKYKTVLFTIVLLMSSSANLIIKDYYWSHKKANIRDPLRALSSYNVDAIPIFTIDRRSTVFNYYLSQYDSPQLSKDISEQKFSDLDKMEEFLFIGPLEENNEIQVWVNENFEIHEKIKTGGIGVRHYVNTSKKHIEKQSLL
ncbi:MAG: glycosyltransferase family 39 protein [Bacteroidota bacterium]